MIMTLEEKKAFANSFTSTFGLFDQSEIMAVLDVFYEEDMNESDESEVIEQLGKYIPINEMMEQFKNPLPIVNAIILWRSAIKYHMETQLNNIEIQTPKVSKTVTTTTWYGDFKEVAI